MCRQLKKTFGNYSCGSFYSPDDLLGANSIIHITYTYTQCLFNWPIILELHRVKPIAKIKLSGTVVPVFLHGGCTSCCQTNSVTTLKAQMLDGINAVNVFSSFQESELLREKWVKIDWSTGEGWLHDHRLNGSSSPVLTATCLSYGRLCDFLGFFFPNRPGGHTPRPILTQNGSNDVGSRKDVPFGVKIATFWNP